jgi:hypothetical protein
MSQTLRVTTYEADKQGFWTDRIADEFAVPFEVVQLKTGPKGDEMWFVGADGREVCAVDIDGDSLRTGPDAEDEHTPTGPVSLHRRVATLIQRYGLAAVEATVAFQGEVLDDQANSDPELAARVRQTIDQANGPERGRDRRTA